MSPSSHSKPVLVFFLCLAAGICASAQKKTFEFYDVPNQQGRLVHDEAGLLKAETISELERTLKNYQDSTHHQVAVLIIYDLNGVLESYARKAVSEWKLGKKDKDGVLLLIIEKSREVRIEVGKGLVDNLTPTECNYIIDSDIVPNFREKQYDQGTTAAVNGILAGIHGDYAIAQNNPARFQQWYGYASALLIFIAAFGVFSKKYVWVIYAVLLLLVAFTLGVIQGWEAVAVFAVAFPLVRLIVIRSKASLWTLGKNANWDGKHGEDGYDEMERRRLTSDSSDSSDSSSSSSSSSSDSSGSSGRW